MRMMKHLVLIGALLAAGVAAAAETLRIHDPWIPEPPPVARMLAGYLELENAGEETVAIVEIRAGGFARAEIHRTETVDGVSRMRRQEHVEVAAGDTLSFRPGGLHLMLIGPETVPRAGETVEIVLVDEHGREWPFQAMVRPRREP